MRPTRREPAPVDPAERAPLIVDFVTGRLRGCRHLAIAALGAAAAWAWFGHAGLVPMLLWGWSRRPRPGQPRRRIVHRVTRVRLGPWRTLARGSRGEWLEVFADELPAAQLAGLRRDLKSRVSTGDRLEDIQAV